MRGAEFRTRREGLGLEQHDLAKLCDVHIRTVQRWDDLDTDVPETAKNALMAFNDRVSALYEKRRDVFLRASRYQPVVLFRFHDVHEQAKLYPDSKGIPLRAYACVLFRVMQALKAKGIECHITWYSP